MLLIISAFFYLAIPGICISTSTQSSNELQKSANSTRRSLTRRDTGSLSKDDVGWSNINEEVDIALKKMPLMVEKGYTSLLLPDLSETISVRPLFITYAAGLKLSNGYIYNMEQLERAGDIYMTYSDKSFQFRLTMNIRSMQYVYDFLLSAMGISGGGTVGGKLTDTLVVGDFSIIGDSASLHLDNFKVVSFGNMEVSLLKGSAIIRQISSSLLSPFSRLFESHIASSISDTLRDQIRVLMEDINRTDLLELKKLVKNMIGGLTG